MKKLTHHTVFVVAVLITYLINSLVLNVLGKFEKLHHNKYLSVLIYMTAIVIVFYPVSRLISMAGEQVGQAVIKRSQKSLGSPFIGWLLGCIFLFMILFSCYAWVTYKITVVEMVKTLF